MKIAPKEVALKQIAQGTSAPAKQLKEIVQGRTETAGASWSLGKVECSEFKKPGATCSVTIYKNRAEDGSYFQEAKNYEFQKKPNGKDWALIKQKEIFAEDINPDDIVEP